MNFNIHHSMISSQIIKKTLSNRIVNLNNNKNSSKIHENINDILLHYNHIIGYEPHEDCLDQLAKYIQKMVEIN